MLKLNSLSLGSRLSVVLAVLAIIGRPLPSLAWGPDGHKIVAAIAAANLTPQAQTAVHALLGNQTLADVSTWADDIKSDHQYDWAKPLHYADLPAGATAFDPKQDIPKEGCVVTAIGKYAAVLKDNEATPAQRAEALRFLIHFVADAHQPLRAGHAHDKGGNDVKVEFLGDRTNLHTVWDSLLIRRARIPWKQYAEQLRKGITPEQAKRWGRVTDPAVWVTESHRLAESNAYAVPADGVPGQAYFERNLPVVNEQLSKAGIRLAIVLNTVLTDARNLPAAPATAPAEARPRPAFVGSRRSEVYHYPTCRDVQRIKPENRVEYAEVPEDKRLHQGCPR